MQNYRGHKFSRVFFCVPLKKERNKLLTREKNEHEREELMNDFELFQVSGEQMGRQAAQKCVNELVETSTYGKNDENNIAIYEKSRYTSGIQSALNRIRNKKEG